MEWDYVVTYQMKIFFIIFNLLSTLIFLGICIYYYKIIRSLRLQNIFVKFMMLSIIFIPVQIFGFIGSVTITNLIVPKKISYENDKYVCHKFKVDKRHVQKEVAKRCFTIAKRHKEFHKNEFEEENLLERSCKFHDLRGCFAFLHFYLTKSKVSQSSVDRAFKIVSVAMDYPNALKEDLLGYVKSNLAMLYAQLYLKKYKGWGSYHSEINQYYYNKEEKLVIDVLYLLKDGSNEESIEKLSTLKDKAVEGLFDKHKDFPKRVLAIFNHYHAAEF